MEVDRRGVRDQGGVSTAVVVVLAGKAISCGRLVVVLWIQALVCALRWVSMMA